MAVGALKKEILDFLRKPVDDNALVDGVIRALASDAPPPGQRGTSQATVATRIAQLTPRGSG